MKNKDLFSHAIESFKQAEKSVLIPVIYRLCLFMKFICL